MSAQLEEVGRTADAVREGLEAAFVRGLATSTKADRRLLEARTEEWERVGAHHVATRLRAALRAADANAKDAPEKLLSAYTSLHAFERVLSLEVAKRAWSTAAPADEPPAPAPSAAASTSAPSLEDPKGAQDLLAELTRTLEDLVRTGLPSATDATRAKLDTAFKEASRRKLLRLGASLRYVAEEVGRFLGGDGAFTARRYSFFLHRSWLLAKGIRLGLAEKDAALVASLTAGAASAPRPVGTLEVVTLGIVKRTTSVAAAFDFRLRVLSAAQPELVARSLVLSFVFTRKGNVPPEAYLHLPQPQELAPKIFVAPTRLAVTEAGILEGAGGADRLVLSPKSKVTVGAPFEAWSSFRGVTPAGALARIEAHAPTPLDLAVELQEEVLFSDWTLVPAPAEASGLAVSALGLLFAVALPPAEGDAELVRARLEAAATKKKRAPLFGTVHYELGRLVLTPLTLLVDDGPLHLMMSDEKINLAALLGSLDLGS